jgi:hypothetical protein
MNDPGTNYVYRSPTMKLRSHTIPLACVLSISFFALVPWKNAFAQGTTRTATFKQRGVKFAIVGSSYMDCKPPGTISVTQTELATPITIDAASFGCGGAVFANGSIQLNGKVPHVPRFDEQERSTRESCDSSALRSF